MFYLTSLNQHLLVLSAVLYYLGSPWWVFSVHYSLGGLVPCCWKKEYFKVKYKIMLGLNSYNSSGESSWRSLIWKSLFLNILSFCCTYSWYISVPLTSVAGNTAVYNSCCVFVFLLSVFVLGEDFSAMKMFSVILCVCGAISVSVLGANEETESDWPLKWRAIGYGLVFVSMICYATYQVFYKKFSISESPWCSVNILWLVGLWDIAMFPLVVGISWFEIEPISWPGWYVIRSIAFMTLLDALFGLLTVVAITLSSPLLVSCTSLMTIPTAILADIVFLHKTLPVFAFVGVAAIVAGFLAFNLETFVEARRAKYKLISSLPPRANQTYNSV